MNLSWLLRRLPQAFMQSECRVWLAIYDSFMKFLWLSSNCHDSLLQVLLNQNRRRNAMNQRVKYLPYKKLPRAAFDNAMYDAGLAFHQFEIRTAEGEKQTLGQVLAAWKSSASEKQQDVFDGLLGKAKLQAALKSAFDGAPANLTVMDILDTSALDDIFFLLKIDDDKAAGRLSEAMESAAQKAFTEEVLKSPCSFRA
jgi:hypothetical protein